MNRKVLIPIAALTFCMMSTGLHAGQTPNNSKATANPEVRTFSGNLVDADCKADDSRRACVVTSTTKAFGIQMRDGKYLKLDIGGNAEAHMALRRRHIKPHSITAPVSGVKATVSGMTKGDTIEVQALEVY